MQSLLSLISRSNDQYGIYCRLWTNNGSIMYLVMNIRRRRSWMMMKMLSTIEWWRNVRRQWHHEDTIHTSVHICSIGVKKHLSCRLETDDNRWSMHNVTHSLSRMWHQHSKAVLEQKLIQFPLFSNDDTSPSSTMSFFWLFDDRQCCAREVQLSGKMIVVAMLSVCLGLLLASLTGLATVIVVYSPLFVGNITRERGTIEMRRHYSNDQEGAHFLSSSRRRSFFYIPPLSHVRIVRCPTISSFQHSYPLINAFFIPKCALPSSSVSISTIRSRRWRHSLVRTRVDQLSLCSRRRVLHLTFWD